MSYSHETSGDKGGEEKWSEEDEERFQQFRRQLQQLYTRRSGAKNKQKSSVSKAGHDEESKKSLKVTESERRPDETSEATSKQPSERTERKVSHNEKFEKRAKRTVSESGDDDRSEENVKQKQGAEWAVKREIKVERSNKRSKAASEIKGFPCPWVDNLGTEKEKACGKVLKGKEEESVEKEESTESDYHLSLTAVEDSECGEGSATVPGSHNQSEQNPQKCETGNRALDSLSDANHSVADLGITMNNYEALLTKRFQKMTQRKGECEEFNNSIVALGGWCGDRFRSKFHLEKEDFPDLFMHPDEIKDEEFHRCLDRVWRAPLDRNKEEFEKIERDAIEGGQAVERSVGVRLQRAKGELREALQKSENYKEELKRMVKQRNEAQDKVQRAVVDTDKFQKQVLQLNFDNSTVTDLNATLSKRIEELSKEIEGNDQFGKMLQKQKDDFYCVKKKISGEEKKTKTLSEKLRERTEKYNALKKMVCENYGKSGFVSSKQYNDVGSRNNQSKEFHDSKLPCGKFGTLPKKVSDEGGECSYSVSKEEALKHEKGKQGKDKHGWGLAEGKEKCGLGHGRAKGKRTEHTSVKKRARHSVSDHCQGRSNRSGQ